MKVSGYTPLLNSARGLKKYLPHPLKWAGLRKSNKQTGMATLYKLLILSGLPYAVNLVIGVFHRLNTVLAACLAPMNGTLLRLKSLILSSLNTFLGSSKNSFLLV
jgi:hypothetical protein